MGEIEDETILNIGSRRKPAAFLCGTLKYEFFVLFCSLIITLSGCLATTTDEIAMDPDTVYKGIVTFFSVERHFGFIDSEIQEDLFFFIDVTKMRKMKPEEKQGQQTFYIRGDEVYFKIKPAINGRTGIEACDIRYIRNEKVDELLGLIREQKLLTGYIKKLDSGYFIKDKQTYLFIPLHISFWEVALEEVYESRINEPVSYIVEKIPGKIKNLKAVLTDRIIDSVYYQIGKLRDTKDILTLRITGKNKKGYYAEFTGISASTFIHFDKEEKVPHTLNKGDIVMARIRSLSHNAVKVDLVNNPSDAI